jgi:hypothetical protein
VVMASDFGSGTRIICLNRDLQDYNFGTRIHRIEGLAGFIKG